MRYDIIIKNGEIIDGSGNSSYKGDISISEGKISLISRNIDCDAYTVIDAHGKIVSPGFIDPHAHNDGYIFHDPSNSYKLSQGVTTEISGNCGEGLVPVSDEYYNDIFEYYRPYYPLEDFKTYTSGKKYYSKIDELPLGNNVAYLCAHGTLRMSVMGFSNKKADSSQIHKMKEKLAECMEAGALGMSTGLVYSPGCFADTNEIIELCKVVKSYGGVYTSHIRSEGFKLIEAIEETIEIARKTNVKTVISHLKVLGKNYWGMSPIITRMIEDARDEGLEIFCDQYPYTNSCTVLHWVIPIEYTEGGFAKMCEKLALPSERQKIKDMYQNKHGSWDNLMENITPSGIHILKADNTPAAIGKTLQEYADFINSDPYDALFDIIIDNNADAIAAFDCMDEKDINLIMKKDYCMVGSDGIDVMPDEKTHPRLTGTFPRVLGKYVREQNIISLETAIRKMTSLPASVMGLPNKGLLKCGYDADVCIFDKNTIIDKGTFDKFNIRPEGINYVIVNGKIALSSNGNYTGSASGKRLTIKGGKI